MDTHDLGRRIRAARDAAGLTQGQLAELVDVEQPTICGWETGRGSPRLDNLRRLAEALELSLPDLLTYPLDQEVSA